jgi:hypothetical protein
MVPLIQRAYLIGTLGVSISWSEASLLPHRNAQPAWPHDHSLASRTNDWASKNCSSGSITNVYEDSSVRWSDADCEDAWKAVVVWWGAKKDAGLPFAAVTSDYFKAKEKMNCQDIDDTNCKTQLECGDVNYPAG